MSPYWNYENICLGRKTFYSTSFEYQRDSWNFFSIRVEGWKFRELIKKIKTKGICFYYKKERKREGILFKFQLLLDFSNFAFEVDEIKLKGKYFMFPMFRSKIWKQFLFLEGRRKRKREVHRFRIMHWVRLEMKMATNSGQPIPSVRRHEFGIPPRIPWDIFPPELVRLLAECFFQ